MAVAGLLKIFTPNILSSTPSTTAIQQVRNYWQNRWMIRDVKRRRLNHLHYFNRLCVNSLRKNDILPAELREIADVEINAFPLNASPLRINNRCAITSRRPKGTAHDFRLSRIVFRHLADYNKLSGVERAMWSHTKNNPFKQQQN